MKKLLRRAYRVVVAGRIANEVRKSGVEPGKVACIMIDSDGTVHVSPA